MDSTTARGYGSPHQRARAAALKAFTPGQPCARCGQPIERAWGHDGRSLVDLGHADDRQGYRGLEHANQCNRAAAGTTKPLPRRRPTPPHPGLIGPAPGGHPPTPSPP